MNKKERKYRVDSGDEAGVKIVSMMEKMVDSLVDSENVEGLVVGMPKGILTNLTCWVILTTIFGGLPRSRRN